MTTTLDKKHRAVIKAFSPGDVVKIEPQSLDVIILRRMKPANDSKQSLARAAKKANTLHKVQRDMKAWEALNGHDN